MEELKKYPSGKTGVCMNCMRTIYIAAADGHCAACHNAVKGIKPGTPDYTTALSDAKKRIMVIQKKVKQRAVKPSRNLESAPRAVNPLFSSDPPMAKVAQNPGTDGFISSGVLVRIADEAPLKPSVVSHIDAAAALANIVTKMQAEYDYHLSMSERYSKAISALNY